jgi:hypothetical protein
MVDKVTLNRQIIELTKQAEADKANADKLIAALESQVEDNRIFIQVI